MEKLSAIWSKATNSPRELQISQSAPIKAVRLCVLLLLLFWSETDYYVSIEENPFEKGLFLKLLS